MAGSMRVLVIALLAAAGPVALAAEPSGVTIRHAAHVERVLDAVLGGGGSGARTVCLVLDPTPSLQKSGLPGALHAAFARHARRLGKVQFAVWKSGAASFAVAPTSDLAAVEKAVTTVVAGAKGAYRNVFADLRSVAKALSKARGTREVVLFSLENGDTFDDLPATAKALKRARVKLTLVVREAFLADSHYISKPRWKAPREETQIGGDAVLVDVPWYWLGQMRAATSYAPSGRPYWAFSRLAAATKARVYLYYPGAGTYSCTITGVSCIVCRGNQIAPEYPYNAAALRALEPHVGKQRAAIALMARDPIYRALFRIWDEAANSGLVLGRPPLSGSSKVSKRLTGNLAPIGRTLSLNAEINRARRLITDCDLVCRRLDQLVAAKMKGPRSRALAAAEYTRVMAHLTRLNLMYFVAFCRDVAPKAIQRKALAPPDRPPYMPAILTGISSSPISLSHGVGALLFARFPGGKKTDAALRAFRDVSDSFLLRYANTPFAMAFRRAGLARWRITGTGKSTGTINRLPGSTGKDTTTEGKPDRPTDPSSGGTGGPTSGGG